MKVEVTNRQRIKRINRNQIRNYVKGIFSWLDVPSAKVSILFCDNDTIRPINAKYFQRDIATDVIAFPLADEFDSAYLGEVVISVEEAVKAAADYGDPWQRELVLYLVHGILHLVGYQDTTRAGRKEMEKKQQELMNNLF